MRRAELRLLLLKNLVIRDDSDPCFILLFALQGLDICIRKASDQNAKARVL